MGAGNVLLGMIILLDTTFNTGTGLLDLGPCFDPTQNYAFNLNVTGCLYGWKTAQYTQYGLQYFNYTPPVVPVVCNAKCTNVGRNTSISLVKYDTTKANGVANAFFKSVVSLQISSNITQGNIDQMATANKSVKVIAGVYLLIVAMIVTF